MIYQYVKRYLKNTLLKPTADFTWSVLNNIQFSTYIEKRYTNEEFSNEISEVKEAFRDFCAPVGKIIFRYTEKNGIKIKIFPYRVKPKDSKHLANIVKIIHNNRKNIKFPYQGQDDQIAIMGKIRREVNREVADTDESINVRELIKYAIRVALELNEKDIITQLKRVYIVKIFKKGTTVEIEEELKAPSQKKDTSDKFNGYTAEQIEDTYKEIFVRGDTKIEYFLKDTMKNLFRNNLDFGVISNKYYEEKALRIIHAGVAKELHNYIELEHDYILGITGYLMRKHFYKIHELMAIELIERIYEKDINANNFLLYYNGKTILVDNRKYMIPCLETNDGRQWNNSSLIGICNLWMNTKKRKESFEHKLGDTDMKLIELKKKLVYIQPERDAQETIIKDTTVQYDVLIDKHTEIESKLQYLETSSLNSTEYFQQETSAKESNQKITELQNVINSAKDNLNAIKDANANIYAELEFFTNQKMQLQHDIKSQNLNIDSKSAQMDPIIESIVKVLMARTKFVGND